MAEMTDLKIFVPGMLTSTDVPMAPDPQKMLVLQLSVELAQAASHLMKASDILFEYAKPK